MASTVATIALSMNSDLINEARAFEVVSFAINRPAPRFIPIPMLAETRQGAIKKTRHTGACGGEAEVRKTSSSANCDRMDQFSVYGRTDVRE